MKKVINGKAYNTSVATKVATDEYWDGSNWDRCGRTITLYKTKSGAFFVCCCTRWEKERDRIEPVSKAEAIYYYEKKLPIKLIEYEEAFDCISPNA